MPTAYRRGDVVLVALDPVVGSEQVKVRPCVLVSNDAAHAAIRIGGRGVVVAVPLTTNVTRIFPVQVFIEPSSMNGVTRPSKAQAEQIRAISPERIVRKLGAVDRETMAAIDEALRVHLML